MSRVGKRMLLNIKDGIIIQVKISKNQNNCLFGKINELYIPLNIYGSITTVNKTKVVNLDFIY